MGDTVGIQNRNKIQNPDYTKSNALATDTKSYNSAYKVPSLPQEVTRKCKHYSLLTDFAKLF